MQLTSVRKEAVGDNLETSVAFKGFTFMFIQSIIFATNITFCYGGALRDFWDRGMGLTIRTFMAPRNNLLKLHEGQDFLDLHDRTSKDIFEGYI